MKKILFIIICAPFLTYSQKVTSVIVDEQSKLPIPYCAIQNLNTNFGSYSDLKGFFEYEDNNDTLIISHISYKKIILPVKKIKDTIKLKINNQLLNEVTISSKKIKFDDWSATEKNKHQWFIQTKTEFAVLLKTQENRKTIKNIRFPLEYSDNPVSNLIYSATFRLNLYENKNGKIGNKINIGNIISNLIIQKNNYIEFELNETIEIPQERFFIGIEFIGFENQNRKLIDSQKNNLFKLEFTTTQKSETYYHNIFINNGNWSLLGKNSPAFPFELKDNLDLILNYK